MENSFAQISELFAQFSENAKLQIEKGNKAAGMRARKASLELEKLLKQLEKNHWKPPNDSFRNTYIPGIK